ncbi:MAG: hypothetical protein ACO4AI_12525, partial [Prochlorothrix sp.]
MAWLILVPFFHCGCGAPRSGWRFSPDRQGPIRCDLSLRSVLVGLGRLRLNRRRSAPVGLNLILQSGGGGGDRGR